MQKCRDCNGTLKSDELQCFACGAVVRVLETRQTIFGKRFMTFLNIAFICSCVLTVAAIFFDFTPPFVRCAILTFILGVIRSSAGQMTEKKES